LKRDSVKPAPGTHNPMNVTLDTFDKIEKNNKAESKVQHFGLDSKFEYTRAQKKKIVEKRPDPSSYRTTFEWKGKDISPKKTMWETNIYKGPSSSVYH